MFKKKATQDAGPARDDSVPIRAIVVTAEAIIEGTVDDATFVSIPVEEDSVGSSANLDLRDVTFRPLDGGAAPGRSVARFSARGDRIVALLLADGSGIDDHGNWGQYQHELPGVFHFGPFLIEGTMRQLNPKVMNDVMPVVDVRMSGPAGALDLTASFALANTRWLYGYEPREA